MCQVRKKGTHEISRQLQCVRVGCVAAATLLLLCVFFCCPASRERVWEKRPRLSVPNFKVKQRREKIKGKRGAEAASTIFKAHKKRLLQSEYYFRMKGCKVR